MDVAPLKDDGFNAFLSFVFPLRFTSYSICRSRIGEGNRVCLPLTTCKESGIKGEERGTYEGSKGDRTTNHLRWTGGSLHQRWRRHHQTKSSAANSACWLKNFVFITFHPRVGDKFAVPRKICSPP
jgi:hypothetical protein